jgi:hypothetical protein
MVSTTPTMKNQSNTFEARIFTLVKALPAQGR